MTHLTYVSPPKGKFPRVSLISGILPRIYVESGWIIVYPTLFSKFKVLEDIPFFMWKPVRSSPFVHSLIFSPLNCVVVVFSNVNLVVNPKITGIFTCVSTGPLAMQRRSRLQYSGRMGTIWIKGSM